MKLRDALVSYLEGMLDKVVDKQETSVETERDLLQTNSPVVDTRVILLENILRVFLSHTCTSLYSHH